MMPKPLAPPPLNAGMWAFMVWWATVYIPWLREMMAWLAGLGGL